MSFMTMLRSLLQRRRAAREINDELAFHLEMETRANIASGMTPVEARLAARRELRGAAQTREKVQEVRMLRIETIWQDVRLAARTLGSHPRFTLTAAAMLALAIGLTTAMFTVVDALVLRPVPFREPGQLALLHTGSDSVVPAVVFTCRESPAFEAVESALPSSAVLETGDTVVARGLAAVTPGVFEMLGGLRPLHGRLFHPTEGQPGEADRVLVSETLWRTLYGADPALVGRTINVDGERLTVVGILPADFRFPAANTVLWRPTDLRRHDKERARLYVRFGSGVPGEDAVRIATDAARHSEPARPTLQVRASPVAGLTDAYSTRALPLLAGGVGLVFFTLCANVGSLLLARVTSRRREFSMRSALGASRSRLMRQALTESMVLGLLGVATGVSVAWALVSVARALLPEPLLAQTLNPLNIDARAVAASSVAGLVATVAAGLLPAWLGSRVNAGESLRVTDRSGTEALAARAASRGLLIVEVALACTLLVSAALLTRSFVNLVRADRGLVTSGVTTAWLVLPSSERSEEAAVSGARRAYVRAIEDELRRLPGVQQLAWSYGIPPEGGFQEQAEWLSDVPEATAVDMELNHYMVSPEFFPLYGIPILAGRSFDATDGFTEVIVGEQFARALWREVNPVGRTFRNRTQARQTVGRQGPDAIYRVVGLARETRYPALDDERGLDSPEIYHLYRPAPTPMVSLRCEPECGVAAIRHRLASTHPAVHVNEARLTAERYAREIVRPRASAALAVAFAVIALAAAAGGLLSVLSYAVNRRRREFGIRVALGASPGQIRRVVMRDGLVVAAIGLTIGSVFAATLARALASLQYGVTWTDPVSWSVVVGLIVLATAAASWGPARVAATADPLELLRGE